MKYLLLIYIDGQALSGTEREACYADSVQLTHQLKSRGQYLTANPLHPTSTATSVRVRGGKALVTDRPFAVGSLGPARIRPFIESSKCPCEGGVTISLTTGSSGLVTSPLSRTVGRLPSPSIAPTRCSQPQAAHAQWQ
jgi:hypothetical protein